MTKFFVILLLLCCGGGAFAAQSLNSATGYGQLPSAAVAPTGEIEISGAYVRTAGTNELSALRGSYPCDGKGFNLRALAGVTKHFEFGLGYLKVDKSYGNATAFTVAGKAKLMEKSEQGLSVSAGASYRSWSSDLRKEIPADLDTLIMDLPSVTSLYLVLDKDWPKTAADSWQGKASLGVVYDHFSDSQQRLASGIPYFVVPDDFPISSAGKVKSENFLSPFVALQLSNGDWSLIADYKPRLEKSNFKYASEVWSAAVRKQCRLGLAVTAGVTNFNLPYTDSDGACFIDFSFPVGK